MEKNPLKSPRKKKTKESPVEGVIAVQESTQTVEGTTESGQAIENATQTDTEVIIVEKVQETEDQQRTRIAKKAFLRALRKTMGEIKAACLDTGIVRSTFYEWRQNDREFRKALEDVDTEILDDIEGVMYKQIRDGDGNLAYRVLQSRHSRYKPTLKTEIVTGERTFEDILYEQALKRKAISEGKDPNTIQLPSSSVEVKENPPEETHG